MTNNHYNNNLKNWNEKNVIFYHHDQALAKKKLEKEESN